VYIYSSSSEKTSVFTDIMRTDLYHTDVSDLIRMQKNNSNTRFFIRLRHISSELHVTVARCFGMSNEECSHMVGYT
jgi:hypothetical protein